MNRLVLAGGGLAFAVAAVISIVDGKAAKRTDFPAVCDFVAEGKRPCTCVLVGPEIALTAAHCMKEGARGETRYRRVGSIGILDQGARPGDCQVASDLDLAVCKVNRVENIQFESLSSAPLASDLTLLLMGFGCTNRAFNNGGPLRKREIKVNDPSLEGNLIRIGGIPLLCSGDSGGPAFVLSASGGELGPRLIGGINSEDFHLASISTQEAKDFIRDAHRGASICGITPRAQGCRP